MPSAARSTWSTRRRSTRRRTAKAADLLHAHRGGSVLVALGDDELAAAKSFRNLSRVFVLHVDDVGVADLVARGDARALPERAGQPHGSRRKKAS